MKRFLPILLCLFSSLGLAQSNGFSFGPTINVAAHQGKRVQYSVDMKAVPTDVMSSQKIWALQVGKNGDYDFLTTKESLEHENVSGDWKTYTVIFTILYNAQKVMLYNTVEGNGKFQFDNLKFKVENAEGTWDPIPIRGGDFEVTGKDPLESFQSTRKAAGWTVTADKRSDDGSTCLTVTTTGIMFYGANRISGRSIPLKNTTLYYEVYGEGEPLLLLHGNGRSIKSFKNQIPALANRFKVFAIDTRGQGKSIDTTSTSFSYDLFASDVKALLDSLQLRQVNVLGWSDGGNTGLILAMRHPEYVKKLVVMGANIFSSKEAIDEKMLKQVHSDLEALERETSTKSKVTSRLLRMLLTEPNLVFSDLQSINCHTLILAGQKDIIKTSHTKQIAASIPKGRLMILKGASHSAPEEDPEIFNKAVLEFLEKY